MYRGMSRWHRVVRLPLVCKAAPDSRTTWDLKVAEAGRSILVDNEAAMQTVNWPS